MIERAKYEAAYDADGSSGSAVRLVQRAGREGVVLDLGCGYGHVAEPLRDLGLTYVGLDIDAEALANLEQRGFEVGPVDLQAPTAELADRLSDAVNGRPLAAVLTLDVLEHLVDPAACVAGLVMLAERHPGAELVVSLPNVTHVDVAAKLLLGRWEMLPIGLLDSTHLQFFDARRAVSLLVDAGWQPVDAEDVHAVLTEQYTLPEAPHLRRGAPLHEALAGIRRRSDEHGHTYQFVRRYRLGPSEVASEGDARSSDPSPFLAVVLDAAAAGDDALLESLRSQADADFIVLADAPAPGVEERTGAAVVPWREGDLLVSLRSVGAERVVVLSPGTVLAPHYVGEVRRLAEEAPGAVVTLGCSEGTLGGPELEIARFEMLGVVPTGFVVPAAYVLPTSALIDGGLGELGPHRVDLATTVARCVMWCGRVDSAIVAVAAPRSAGFALDDVLTSVVARLDAEPIIHGAGALAPTIALAQEVARHRSEFHELRVRHEALSRARDDEVAELHRRIARQSTPWGALRFAVGRWSSAIVRRIRREAPSEDQS